MDVDILKKKSIVHAYIEMYYTQKENSEAQFRIGSPILLGFAHTHRKKALAKRAYNPKTT